MGWKGFSMLYSSHQHLKLNTSIHEKNFGGKKFLKRDCSRWNQDSHWIDFFKERESYYEGPETETESLKCFCAGKNIRMSHKFRYPFPSKSQWKRVPVFMGQPSAWWVAYAIQSIRGGRSAPHKNGKGCHHSHATFWGKNQVPQLRLILLQFKITL